MGIRADRVRGKCCERAEGRKLKHAVQERQGGEKRNMIKLFSKAPDIAEGSYKQKGETLVSFNGKQEARDKRSRDNKIKAARKRLKKGPTDARTPKQQGLRHCSSPQRHKI